MAPSHEDQPPSTQTRLRAWYRNKHACNMCFGHTCVQSLLPVARVNLRASAPYLAMTSSGSSTLPRVLDILRPCSSLTCMVGTNNMNHGQLLRQVLCIDALMQKRHVSCQVCTDWLMACTHKPSPGFVAASNRMYQAMQVDDKEGHTKPCR